MVSSSLYYSGIFYTLVSASIGYIGCKLPHFNLEFNPNLINFSFKSILNQDTFKWSYFLNNAYHFCANSHL